MAKRDNEPIAVQPTWEYLIRTERRLRRNKPLCRVVQPVGTLLFLFHLLLVTANLALYFGGAELEAEFARLPILPALVEALPRGSKGGVIAFSVLFAYLPPLAVCGVISGIFYLLHRGAGKEVPPLRGSEAACAKALAYKAEAVYELRKDIRSWPTFGAAGVLTGLTALPIVLLCVRLAGDMAAVLEVALACLALLLCLFVLFWVYALLFQIFSLLSALFFLCPGQWKLYMLYRKLDGYWESVDPAEFAKRERRYQESRKKR